MRFRRAQDQDTLELNLVPLIDVLLVVLIFLAATSTFVRYRQLDVSLPQAQAQVSQEAELLLAISQDGRYALNGLWLDASSGAPLRQALTGEKMDQNTSLLILADAQAPHFTVVQAMEAAREAGIHRIHFATQAP
ncbi:biopolymer transporter ExbD [Alcaligenes ammonioxydans]|jgi:biopolymer transport protein ExbD|uniref:Biopolymer transporter ExbD n=1 Tax=Alcaligenes ammonioxydans TaxID=2582914 RepID=A0ABX8SUL6_9BURK|nr:biopolymer transporter ExbD [Alcaligenes ammonioxydans]EJC63206.1 biopolymer transport protein [Alcaligenes faecalis subsp. faecalis NCIB 8687]WGQ36877.1 biopolymer transporter ExbD [Alcaligenes faecalis]MCH1878873.1 biopolymer transporter ExbD [Alcaligenes ammonioxydans]QXX78745.1 biopolymer transporter ExbD [Alcaligenes ammonioxydans]HRK84486.1 biopolymer transporter ExbD [Alcaligenes faecalis]